MPDQSNKSFAQYLRCSLLAGIVLVSLFIQACSQQTPRFPTTKTSKEQTTSPTQSNVETQLLQTVEHAESLGKGNPLLLSSLYSLASYYRSQKQYTKAEMQYKKALKMKEELSGPNHQDVVTILEKYADLLREAKRYPEAENLASRAAAILAKPTSTPQSPQPRAH
ncbi:MAG: hypothetical protein NPIRA04_23260 [Nitrospirales bacterium]|nr:MAG: hypothetical protein NPIRA04_23260 [Nitrospirales bacterium]